MKNFDQWRLYNFRSGTTPAPPSKIVIAYLCLSTENDFQMWIVKALGLADCEQLAIVAQ